MNVVPRNIRRIIRTRQVREMLQESDKKKRERGSTSASLSLENLDVESATPTRSIRPKTIRLYLDLPPSRTFSRPAAFSWRDAGRLRGEKRGTEISRDSKRRDCEIAVEIMTGVARRGDQFASVITAARR